MPPFFVYSPLRLPHNPTRHGELDPHLWRLLGKGYDAAQFPMQFVRRWSTEITQRLSCQG